MDGLVQDAAAKGASIVVGGKRSDAGENFYEPTLLTNVQKSMDIFHTEIFGPVASVVKFDTEYVKIIEIRMKLFRSDALKMANDCDVGLAGYFYSSDISQIFRVSRRMQVGMVGVNEGTVALQYTHTVTQV